MDLSALGSNGFRTYIVANFLSILGIWINRITVAWLGWSLTGSAAWVGVLSFLLFAPTLVTGPYFGALADRIDVKQGALVTQSMLVLLTLLLAVLDLAGFVDIWLLSFIALLFGITASANSPIRLTLVPQLVSSRAIANAITLISINFNAARLIGPAIGGVAIAKLGSGMTALVSFATLLPMLVTLPFLQTKAKAAHSATEGVGAQLLEGLRRVWQSEHLWHAMLVTAISSIIPGGALEILPAVVDGVFHKGASGLGRALSAAGAGALTCGISMTFLSPHLSLRRRVEFTLPWMAGGSLAVLALGLVPGWPFVIGLAFLLGAVGTFTSVTTQAVIQLDAEDRFRGRAIGLWLVVSVGGNAAGALLLGTLADLSNVRTVLIAAGIVGVLASVWAITSFYFDLARGCRRE